MNEQIGDLADGLGDITPLMSQYLKIKAAHADYLLFYRMGDFYELFFEDAVKAAGALDIALTRRGKHLGEDIPMCGVPVHAAEAYLEKLIRKQFRVAVCEQLEDPAEARKRGSKAVVRRDVVRLVTPGTLTEESLLEPRAYNILAALCRLGARYALAAADISTGSFSVASLGKGEIASELARVAPRELLLPEPLLADEILAVALKSLGPSLSPLPAIKFDPGTGERALKNFYRVQSLDGFGAFDRAEVSAAGALIDYLDLTQKGNLPALAALGRVAPNRFMGIDAATRRNLELTQTLSADRRGSLLGAIDRTVTPAGARELAQRLGAPLRDVRAIGARLDALSFLCSQAELRGVLREKLKSAPDIARALGRISVHRGGPRDLAHLRDGVRAARAICEQLCLDDPLKPAPGELRQAYQSMVQEIAQILPLTDRLERYLIAQPCLHARDGGFIESSVHAGLDDARGLRDESRRVIAGLETRYRTQSGVGQLRIKHNGVLGYFVEVTPLHADKLMAGNNRTLFSHRQTIGSAVRFSTDELASLALHISQAGEQALSIEQTLFDEMCSLAVVHASALTKIAQALSVIDVSNSLAELAVALGYVRPLVDESLTFKIERGRHPVVEAALDSSQERPFVPNDCNLSADGPGRLWLVTGPNMAGKSTFLRQNALIAILAQMGAFVPADSAHIGIVDRLFSRVGAGDDLAAGRSTFMVEMVETAAILNQATKMSLVILDEIGRGTATLDGLAIAWATTEHLHETNRSRALFATHYHELTALAQHLDALACVTMRVREWKDTIVFLHEVVAGSADRSYGIHVAKLAGLPKKVVARAQDVLVALEEGSEGHKPLLRIGDLPLFAAGPPAEGEELMQALRAIDPDTLTPKQALEMLYTLKTIVTNR